MDDPNKLNHIFDDPDHNMESPVHRYGSWEAAGSAIAAAVRTAFEGGTVVSDAMGRYKQTFDVGGILVTVSGRIVNNAARIGSAWIPLE